jgi:SAM-dependent methyltransferase
MQFKDYQTFYRLRRKRNNSPADYFEFEEFQAELLVQYLKQRGVLDNGCLTLDLGCGLGGYIAALQKSGARVIGIDFNPPYNVAAAPFAIADALRVPFPNDYFDLVICTNLIEHIPDPAELLREIYRVLKRNGVAYVSYPPYYSPKGGHQFSPFHLFGERFALGRAATRLVQTREMAARKISDESRFVRGGIRHVGLVQTHDCPRPKRNSADAVRDFGAFDALAAD